MLQQENVPAFGGYNNCPTWTLKINLKCQCTYIKLYTLISILSVSNSGQLLIQEIPPKQSIQIQIADPVNDLVVLFYVILS